MIHNKLEAWKSAVELVKEVYTISKNIPVSERFGLTSQLRRAAISVASNIAEGSARNSDKEFIDSPRSKLRGIIDPLYKFLIALVNPAASYGECARRIQFLYHSLGSIAEVETQMIICEALNYLKVSEKLDNDLQNTRQLILGLIKYLRSKH